MKKSLHLCFNKHPMKSMPWFRGVGPRSYKQASLLSWEHTLLILREQGSWFFLPIRKHVFVSFKINIWLGGKCRKSFYPVYNPVQNTPKMNQELDPNFKMFSLFYQIMKGCISEGLLVPYMTKNINSSIFGFCYNLEMKLFLGESSTIVCGKMGSEFCKQCAL